MSTTTSLDFNPLEKYSRAISFDFKNQNNITNKPKPSYIVKMRRDEDGRIIVRCPEPELQGVVTDGAYEDEALKNIKEAIDAVLEAKNNTQKEYNIIVIKTS